jgi:radical SAM superfamily enzyme YgiQ (UPF0313 family)
MISNNVSVLGVFPPFWSDEGPHFILPHFQGMMKSLGIDVQILDLNIEAAVKLKEDWDGLSKNWDNIWNRPENIADCMEKIGIANRLVEVIAIQKPSWLVFLSVNIASCQVVRFLIKKIRAKYSNKIVRIAVGGPLFVGSKDYVNLFPDADIVWKGTLESAIPHFVRQEANEIIQDVSNYKFFPDFSGIDITKYSNPQRLPYILNYGCRFNCRFCHEGAQYPQEKKRSTLGLSNNLKTLLAEFPTAKYIRFFDSSLNSSHSQFLEILDELNGKDILWGCYLTPMPYINRSLGIRMRSAGCVGVNMGVESASNTVRKLMGKPTQLDVVESCIKELHFAGIYISVNLIIGYPGETEDDFNKTVSFITRMAEFVNDVAVNIIGIYAGTALFADAEKLGIDFNDDIQNDFLFNHWTLADGSNTPSIRQDRLLRIESHLESLGLKNMRLPGTGDPGLRAIKHSKDKKNMERKNSIEYKEEIHGRSKL